MRIRTANGSYLSEPVGRLPPPLINKAPVYTDQLLFWVIDHWISVFIKKAF